MTRILIFTPTWLVDFHSGEEAMVPECSAAIKSQILRDGDEFDWHVTVDNPYPIGDHRNVLHQYRQAREYFLHGTWEALLTIEHDNVLTDRGAVQRLIDTPGDVVYAPYVLRHDDYRLSTWRFLDDHTLGASLSQYPRQLKLARSNVVWRVCGAGMGCTLFRRNAIEAIPFEESTRLNPCPDLGFAKKAIAAGLISHGRFDVPVLHLDGRKWLHPYDEEMSVIMKYLALQTINIFVDGYPLHLEAGQVYDLPVATSIDLVRAGYVTPEELTAAAPVERAVAETPEKAVAPAQATPPARHNRAKTLKG